MNEVQLLIIFWAGHYLADFPLQPAFVAEKKGLVFIERIGLPCLTSHAFIHGLVAGTVAAQLGFGQWFLFGLIVGITHWIIDFGKSCQLNDDRFPHTAGARKGPQRFGLYGINIDQTLHLLGILGCVLGLHRF
jgi:Protein of unknown function (DUF3307)